MKRISIFVVVISMIFASCSNKSGGVTPPPNPPPVVVPPVVTVHQPNFYVSGKNLKDSAGNNFIIRGNTFPVFWYPNDYKPAIAAAAKIKCNAARLVWQLRVEAWTPALSKLDEALAECIANKMVPIVELHDFTGGTSATDITNAAAYFVRADVKAIIDKYSYVIIINIANEWGDNNVSDLAWKNAYLPAITTIRNAGYKVPIMIDAPGYGQRETAIVAHGEELLNSDPLKNIIFSAHGYSNWNVSSTYSNRINAILAKNLCFVFGEFGWNVPDNQQPASFTCKVDAPLLMQLCQANNVGYIAWSWKGNDAANACFDMCTSWSDTSFLTTWGRQWAYDANGVKNTAVKATVFP